MATIVEMFFLLETCFNNENFFSSMKIFNHEKFVQEDFLLVHLKNKNKEQSVHLKNKNKEQSVHEIFNIPKGAFHLPFSTVVNFTSKVLHRQIMR